jgi:heme/copper-type cytochrome/quinol oxidase subunit 2
MFELISTIAPIFVVAVIAFAAFSIIRNWTYNKSQPRVAAEATITKKRTDYTTSSTSDDLTQSTSTDWYYITFQFTTGDKKEFSVKNSDYRQFHEAEKGILTFQGNNFIGFQRN